MSIFLNGELRTTSASHVAALVEELGLAPQTLLIEHNGTALHRSEWKDATLRDQDRLEVLRVTAGG